MPQLASQELFPNGQAWRRGIADDPFLVHFNCTVGRENDVNFMRECEMWGGGRPEEGPGGIGS